MSREKLVGGTWCDTRMLRRKALNVCCWDHMYRLYLYVGFRQASSKICVRRLPVAGYCVRYPDLSNIFVFNFVPGYAPLPVPWIERVEKVDWFYECRRMTPPHTRAISYIRWRIDERLLLWEYIRTQCSHALSCASELSSCFLNDGIMMMSLVMMMMMMII